MNVSSGDKLINCAALSSAFTNGIKAFTIDHGHTVLLLWPVLDTEYSATSDAKINILKSIDSIGGMTSRLEELEQVSGYRKTSFKFCISRRKGK